MKIGVVGNGMIVGMFLHDVALVDHAEVVSLCVRPHSLEKGQKIAEEHHIPLVETNYDTDLFMGIINKTGSDISVATTGFAGPATDNDTLPVGTFYIAVSDGINTEVRKYFHNGMRQEVTACGIKEAIDLLRVFLSDKYN